MGHGSSNPNGLELRKDKKKSIIYKHFENYLIGLEINNYTFPSSIISSVKGQTSTKYR